MYCFHKKGRPFGKPTKAVLQTDKIFPCFYAQLQRWKKTKKTIENQAFMEYSKNTGIK
jgi:hypothetical protein